MFQGRTKRGIPIRSTLGMKPNSRAETWILVADRSKLRLFQKTVQGLGPAVELKQTFENPDGRKKGRELVSDRPGRSFDSHDMSHHGQTGGPRHSYGNSFEPEDRVTEALVKHAVGLFQDGTCKAKGSELFVVAEPRLMGSLRYALERALPQTALVFEEKDFAWLDTPDLESRLNELVI